MTRRELIIAGVSAAAVLLVGGGIVAAVWPSDSGDPDPSAGVSIPTVPPEPSITDDPSAPASSETPDDEGDNKGKKPADAPVLPNAPAPGQGPLPNSSPVSCPGATVTATDANSLNEALKNAKPGTSIALADGKYVGKFGAETSGTAAEPIWLCGGAGAVLDGDNIRGGYVLHLNKAKYWRLVGFTVTNGQKGVMADSTVGSVVQGLTVHDIGDEAIHLRANSTDNVVLRNTISKTGLRRDKFGEGVYIGTAESNWPNITGGQPDHSNRNFILNNAISQTTAESVDIKEGTSDGVLAGRPGSG